jgi:hypothetical protein
MPLVGVGGWDTLGRLVGWLSGVLGDLGALGIGACLHWSFSTSLLRSLRTYVRTIEKCNQ